MTAVLKLMSCLLAVAVTIEAGCFNDENVKCLIQDLEEQYAEKFAMNDLTGYMKIFGKKYGFVSLLKPLESDSAAVMGHLKFLRSKYKRYVVKVEEAIQVNCDAIYSITTKTWTDMNGNEDYTRSISLMVKECGEWKVSRYLSANLKLENMSGPKKPAK